MTPSVHSDQVTVVLSPDPQVGLEAVVAAVTDVALADVVAGHRCPHCASAVHGRPWATTPAGRVAVSRASAPGIGAVAVLVPGAAQRDAARGTTEIGVDVERVSRVAAAPLDAFGPDEAAVLRDERDRAAAWAVKEAVLKRDGRGLRVDPSAVSVDVVRGVARFDGAEQPVVVRWLDDDVVLAVAAGGVAVHVEAAGIAAGPDDRDVSAPGA